MNEAPHDNWEQPITRREFFQFHLEKEARFTALALFISFVFAISFVGSAVWGLLSGNTESLGRDVTVALIAAVSTVSFYRQFGRVRAKQKEINKA